MLKLTNLLFLTSYPYVQLLPELCFTKVGTAATKDWRSYEMVNGDAALQGRPVASRNTSTPMKELISLVDQENIRAGTIYRCYYNQTLFIGFIRPTTVPLLRVPESEL